jgi:hypothetical protein
MILLLVCVRLTAGLRTSCQPATIHSLFGLFDGHLVLYVLHTFYIADEFADQALFGCIPGLASQRDQITLATGGDEANPFDGYEPLSIVE